jgi:predicted phage tail protein
VEYLPGFRVFAGPARLSEAEVAHPLPREQVIRIVPVIAGAGDDFGGILLGAALIGLSFFLPATPLFTIGSFAPSLASLAFGFGVNLILGGVINALVSTPAAADPGQRERPENRPSYVFDGAVNTTSQGNPVPILYGEMEVGSQVLSASITTEQLIAVAAPAEPEVASPEEASETQYVDQSWLVIAP